mgnify:CR=1 FL=1
MDKSGIFVGTAVGSVSVFIIFTVLVIIPAESDETIIQMQDEINEINNIILTESKTLSLIEIFEKSEPGVVRVNVQRNQTENDVGGVVSGFVFDKQGHIITNAHVIKDATNTVVTFLDGRSYNAEIIGIDIIRDTIIEQKDISDFNYLSTKTTLQGYGQAFKAVSSSDLSKAYKIYAKLVKQSLVV